METLFITHPSCRLHEMQSWHPESPARLDAINDRLLMSGVGSLLNNCEATPANLDDLKRVHNADYIDFLKSKVPTSGYCAIDTEETSLNPHTFTAILHAAGAGILAVDQIMSKQALNAFCAVRPPGHHAEKDKAMGFCFVNNLAVAARYAIDKYALNRIAIIDFDVHHGNGTENIFANDSRVFMFGFFQSPLFPNSGLDSTGQNMLNVAVPAYTKAQQIRDLISSQWMPKLHEFKPEMIFISAGFDAHRDDDMGQLDLLEKDYVWITEQLMEIAHLYANGRIISFLEGGYDLSSLGRSVTAHIRTLANL